MKAYYTACKNRAVIRVRGENALDFIESLVCNQLSPLTNPVFAAILDLRGRIIADFFAYKHPSSENGDDDIALQTAMPQLLGTQLAHYKLGADVHISQTQYAVFVLWNLDEQKFLEIKQSLPKDMNMIQDPRGDFGIAYLSAFAPACKEWFSSHQHILESMSFAAWQHHRIGLGLLDDEYHQTPLLPFAAHADRLNGISLQKGCYPGQEVCARIHFKGEVKKQIFPVNITIPSEHDTKMKLPQDILNPDDGKHRGELIALSVQKNDDCKGLAWLDKHAVGQPLMMCDGMVLEAYYPHWWNRDDEKEQLKHG